MLLAYCISIHVLRAVRGRFYFPLRARKALTIGIKSNIIKYQMTTEVVSSLMAHSVLILITKFVKSRTAWKALVRREMCE